MSPRKVEEGNYLYLAYRTLTLIIPKLSFIIDQPVGGDLLVPSRYKQYE
jgi:hypothetical protein